MSAPVLCQLYENLPIAHKSPVDSLDDQRTLSQVLLTTFALYFAYAVATAHLDSLLGVTRSTCCDCTPKWVRRLLLPLRIFHLLLLPETQLGRSIMYTYSSCRRYLRDWDRPTPMHQRVAMALGLHAEIISQHDGRHLKRTRPLLDVRSQKVTRTRLKYDIAWFGRVTVLLAFVAQAAASSVLNIRRLQHFDLIPLRDDPSTGVLLCTYQRYLYPLDIHNCIVSLVACAIGLWTWLVLAMNSRYTFMVDTENSTSDDGALTPPISGRHGSVSSNGSTHHTSTMVLEARHEPRECPDSPLVWRELKSIFLAGQLATVFRLYQPVDLLATNVEKHHGNFPILAFVCITMLVSGLYPFVNTYPYRRPLSTMAHTAWIFYHFQHASAGG